MRAGVGVGFDVVPVHVEVRGGEVQPAAEGDADEHGEQAPVLKEGGVARQRQIAAEAGGEAEQAAGGEGQPLPQARAAGAGRGRSRTG